MLDVTALKGKELSAFRKQAQTIFQDPYSSLNPRMTVLQTVGEPLLVNHLAHGKELEERVTEMVVQVGLRVEHLQRYPHSFSGGQRQRIGIARAMVVNPKLVVADEPVSALDVSIQAQILNLLQDLQEKYNLTYLFISHAMSVVRYVSDRIAVMYAGKLVELGPKQELLSHPKHPYTEALLAAVPKPSQRKRGMRLVSPGEPPDLANLPKGCVFVPRCKYATESLQGRDAAAPRSRDRRVRKLSPGRIVDAAGHLRRRGQWTHRGAEDHPVRLLVSHRIWQSVSICQSAVGAKPSWSPASAGAEASPLRRDRISR